MDDNFSEFEKLREKGIDPKLAYLYSKKVGLDPFAQIRMLRSVYNLSIEKAKEVTVTASGESASLSEHQEKLFPSLKRAFKLEEEI